MEDSKISILITLPYSTYLNFSSKSEESDLDVNNYISNFLEEFQDVA